MKSNPFSKFHEILAKDDADSNEVIAREMLAEGLSGSADEDTRMLNARLDHHHFSTHSRQRHQSRNLVG